MYNFSTQNHQRTCNIMYFFEGFCNTLENTTIGNILLLGEDIYMKYVPVLRYRREERGALKSTQLTQKTMPLLEIMKERAGQYRSGDFQTTYLNDFKDFSNPFFVDFPIYFHVINSTTASIRDFLRNLKLNPIERLLYFEQLSSNKNLVPVISYNTESTYISSSYVNDSKRLRKTFSSIAFRIFENKDFDTVLKDIETAIEKHDFLLYDIDDIPHTQDLLINRYEKILKLKTKIGFTSVIIRSAINPNIVFNRLIDNTPVLKADNSLLKIYPKYGFDAFGDFAGIRKDASITDGGPEDPSPGFLFYSAHSNCYIGYKGQIADWGEFTNHIKPTVMKSEYWKNYTPGHHKNCPGCFNISTSPGNSAGNWKRYTIQHYLYTMEEFL